MEASHPETILVEREANRVAKEAADALRESRRLLRRNDIGTPTWTGRFGGSTSAEGVGSETLLERMRYRRGLDSDRTSSVPVTARTERNKAGKLIAEIREYMALQEGSVTSKELVGRFPNVKGPEGIAEFRKMVKQIAEFRLGKWTLKQEYT